MLSTGATRIPTTLTERPTYTVSTNTERLPTSNPASAERIIPIETTTTSPTNQYRV